MNSRLIIRHIIQKIISRIFLVMLFSISVQAQKINSAQEKISNRNYTESSKGSNSFSKRKPASIMGDDWKKEISLALHGVQWTESLRVLNNNTVETDLANYQALYGALEFSFKKSLWAWGLSGGILGGKAVGGGNNSLGYKEKNTPWTGFMASFYGAYLLSESLSFGLQIPALYKNMQWDQVDGVRATAPKLFSYTLLLDLRYTLNSKWEMSQNIGPQGFETGTLWMLGLHRKF